MAGTTTRRPNHYELLGLATTASDADVKAAFAREIGRPRAFGGLLDVSVAYEALRDPAKRRAYDQSIGLTAPKRPAIGLDRFSMALPAIHVGPPPKAVTDSQEADPKTAEPRIASFIASSVRGTAAPAAAPRHDPPPAAAIDPVRAPVMVAVEQADDSGQPALDLKRPAVAVGALVAAVAVIGAWAGVTAGNDAESSQPQRAVTIALPKAKALPPTASPVEDGTAFEPQRPSRPMPVARTVKRAPAAQAPSALATLATETLAEAPAAAEADPLAPVAAEAPAAAPVAASLPLNKATIARTIGRIGYACGAVSATEAMGGGVFKVTCTSGQSYRAAPVHGRYRFKRL